jgi:HlyD family secretion protein
VRWSKRLVLGVLCVAALAALIRAFLPSPVAVDVVTVIRAPLAVEIAEDGQTRVRDRFVIAAPIGGELERVTLRPGDAVATGAVVARIWPAKPALLDERSRSELVARLAAARARERQAATAIARAIAARDSAKRDADRARRLAQAGAITAAERERNELAERLAIEDLSAAEQQRLAASAEAAAIAATLRESGARGTGAGTPVTSPASGRVLRVVRESAGPVAPGAPLLEVGDPGAIEAVIDVLSGDAAKIVPGMEVQLDAGFGHPLIGHVQRVEPSAFTRISALGVEEQRVNVISSIDNPPPALGDGFRVDARIITWRGDAVRTVPASALFRDRGEWAVYTVEADRARLRHVQIGHRGRTVVEIAGGLPDDATVIVHPGDRVSDGVRVTVRRSGA